VRDRTTATGKSSADGRTTFGLVRIEYAAQAMAIHGVLAATSGAAQEGYLAS